MYIAAFALGAIVGSFLNVVLLRKNTGESIIKDRSRCFSCGKKLSWFEIIPIFSFVIQKGRCQKCGSKISWQYPIVEAVTGFLALAVLTQTEFVSLSQMTQTRFGSFGLWFMAYGVYFAAFCVLLLIAVYDFKHKIIDKHFLYIFGGFSVIEFVFKHFNISTFISAIVVFLFFFLLWKVSDGKWMGRGDADLAFFLALFLGFPLNLVMLLFSFWIGAMVGIALLIAYPRKVTIKSEVPFGPFMVLSVFMAWYFGDMLKFIYDFLYF